jgi:hypothetical protein
MGFYSFFTNNNMNYTARALEKTLLLAISYDDFMEQFKNFPLDYEKFCVKLYKLLIVTIILSKKVIARLNHYLIRYRIDGKIM